MSFSYTNVFGAATSLPNGTAYRAFTIAADTTLVWPIESATSSARATPIMEVTASSAGLSLTMPNATLVGPGMSCVFYNPGSNTFTVKDSGGTAIASVASGQAWQVWLRDNSTAVGFWRAIQLGTGTSTASAASLAGPGIAAIGSTLEQIVTVQSVSSTPYTVGASLISRAIVWTGSAGTFTLDSAATLGAGWFAHIKNGGTGTLTINTSGGNTIDGTSSVSLSPNDACIVVTDGLTLYTIGKGQSVTSTFTYLAINVAGSGNYTLSAAEYAKTALKFTGALTGARTISAPATVQAYYVNNATSGAYTLTFQVTGAPGAVVVVPAGGTMILYSDGTNIINASSAGISTPISIANGGTGSTTASAALTALGGTAVGTSVFTATTAANGRTALAAAPTDAPTFTTSATLSSGNLTVTSGKAFVNTTGTVGNAAALEVYGSARFGSLNTTTPPLSSAAGGMEVTWNLSAANGETVFWNLYEAYGWSFTFKQKTGTSTYRDVANLTPGGHSFYGPSNTEVISQGSSGYGAFKALSSGTNNAYHFFNNGSGERVRILGDNGRNFYVSCDGGTTNALQVSNGGAIFSGTSAAPLTARAASGLASVNVESSGTNAAYAFFRNGGGATEHGRIAVDNGDIMYLQTGTAATTRVQIGPGVQIGAPTGGDKGAGTINVASGLYLNGIPVGVVVQEVSTIVTAYATGSTAIPLDNTIPQNTEGDQYMSLAITPKSATSTLDIEVVFNAGITTSNTLIVALFQDATANALAVSSTTLITSATGCIVVRHRMTSGTTSATTFKVRAGMNSASAVYFNGASAAQLFGGASASSITIREVL